MVRQGFPHWFSVVLLFLAIQNNARAQALNGAVVGNVRDASDALISGASVTLINAATGQSRQTTTTPLGSSTCRRSSRAYTS